MRNNAQADLDRARAEARVRADAGVDPARLQSAALDDEIRRLRGVIATADATAAATQNDIAQAQQRVQALREAEAARTEAWQVQELRERRARENEFRRDVAAATVDPNTYAPGVPESDDPVQQVSVSVIGEGVIQLRGPIKGINIIRIMINQIDAPVGQVRLAMHTVQVNGERGDRMEKVVANIQRYIDHSRFLTTQSAQMLRKAVGVVAARKAEEAALTFAPGCTQADRDARYLYTFFGKEFTDELALLDSEFLKTGNKLLSLHSMDTTSLASALFVMSLARNDVRAEIVQEFYRQLQVDLPQAESEYYQAGLVGGAKCDACCDHRHYVLAYNAKFASFKGFFDLQVAGPDTMTPVQREFVRLAQIFKARMVTEVQLKQRVTERAMVEERFAKSYPEQRKAAIDAEEEARKRLNDVEANLPAALIDVQSTIGLFATRLDAIHEPVNDIEQLVVALQGKSVTEFTQRNDQLKSANTVVPFGRSGVPVTIPFGVVDSVPKTVSFKDVPAVRTRLIEVGQFFAQFYYQNKTFYDQFLNTQTLIQQATTAEISLADLEVLKTNLHALAGLVRTEAATVAQVLGSVAQRLQGDRPDLTGAITQFRIFRESVRGRLRRNQPLFREAEALFQVAEPAFQKLAGYEEAKRRAQQARRPLDEKKLLDLLVDEIEDKFIEQLEGTRAHTANIDNYIKALSTALDDDFQTQFYNPAFRKVREASRFWDVTLGQVETTTVLANNRGFAKVSPSATFEFDLPKRDIMITEGFKSAKALVDDYGALVNDPSFLALAKLYSGNPVTGQMTSGGSLSAVRNVLPGLPTSADEQVLAQAGPGRRDFGSALEGLIPDPAIYKFETGTGFEVRPVLSPDGQNVVFKLDYMYTTDVREPVRADEKHLGRVKRHFVNTDVQLGNYELREVSKYLVALKASRTGKGVPGLQDIPGVGVLFRPLPSAESSLQQNLIYSQATIFPTLFDLMGLRYAPAIADLDPLADRLAEFAARNRHLDIIQRTADIGASRVDDALRTPNGERRADLYRPQVSIPAVHPNGYVGPGLRLRDGTLVEGPPAPPGYDPRLAFPPTGFNPMTTPESAPRPILLQPTGPTGYTPLGGAPPQPLHQPRQVPPDLPNPPDANGVMGRLAAPYRGGSGTTPPATGGAPPLDTVIAPGARPLPFTPPVPPPPLPALPGAARPVGLPPLPGLPAPR